MRVFPPHCADNSPSLAITLVAESGNSAERQARELVQRAVRPQISKSRGTLMNVSSSISLNTILPALSGRTVGVMPATRESSEAGRPMWKSAPRGSAIS